MHGAYKRIEQFLGLHMTRENTAHELLSQFIFNLSGKMEKLEPVIISGFEGSVLDLLIMALDSVKAVTLSGHRKRLKPRSNNRFRSAKRLINRNLRNTNVSPKFIAKHLWIGKRYSHMLFAKGGISVFGNIRNRRLKACSKVLAHSVFLDSCVTSTALESSFADAFHFNR